MSNYEILKYKDIDENLLFLSLFFHFHIFVAYGLLIVLFIEKILFCINCLKNILIQVLLNLFLTVLFSVTVIQGVETVYRFKLYYWKKKLKNQLKSLEFIFVFEISLLGRKTT